MIKEILYKILLWIICFDKASHMINKNYLGTLAISFKQDDIILASVRTSELGPEKNGNCVGN